MNNLLCIGGIFDGQRKEVGNQIWHKFVTSTFNINEQVIGIEETDATMTLTYEEYRTSRCFADGFEIKFLVVKDLSDGDVFKLLLNSYESVRQVNEARKN